MITWGWQNLELAFDTQGGYSCGAIFSSCCCPFLRGLPWILVRGYCCNVTVASQCGGTAAVSGVNLFVNYCFYWVNF